MTESGQDKDLQVRQVAVDWSAADRLPLQFVNQIAAQLGVPTGVEALPDGIVITFGTAAQPLLVGTPESVQARVDELQSIAVLPVARIVLSRQRTEELLQILAIAVGQYDQIAAARASSDARG